MSAQKIRAGRAVVEVAAEDKGLAKTLAGIEARMRAFGQTMGAAGSSMLAMGGSVFAPLAVAARTFGAYERALSDLRAAANPTAEQFDRVKAAIDRVSAATGRDQATTAGAFTELLKAGMPLERVLGGAAEAAVKFARVGDVDVAQAATAMNDAINVFSKEGVTATEAIDTLSKAADASSISIHQITEAFAMSASVYGDAGLRMGDLTSAIAILGNAGVKGSDAGTSLKTMLQMLRAPVEKGAETIAQLGINVRDAGGRMLPMAGIVAELSDKLGRLDTVSRDNVMRDIFGSDAIRAASVLVGQGTKGWDEFQAKLNSSLGVSQKFAVATGNTNDGLAAAWAQITRVGTALGAAFAAPMGAAIGQAGKLLQTVTDWIARNQALVAGLVSVGAKIAVVSVGIGAALLVVSKVTAAVTLATAAVRLLSVAGLALAANPVALAFGVMAASIGAMVVAAARASVYTARYREGADGMIQKGQELRQEDARRMERLRELGKAEQLGVAQQKEAADVIDHLRGRYGDLGVSIDQTTGKVLGLEDAQERMNDAMRRSAVVEAEQKVAEARFNYNEAINAARSQNKGLFANLGNLVSQVSASEMTWTGLRFNPNDVVTDTSAQDAARLKGQALRAAERQLELARGGKLDPVTGQAAGPGGGRNPDAEAKAAQEQADAQERANKAVEDGLRAAEELGDLEEQEAAKRRTELDQQLEDIHRVYNDRRRLIDRVIAGERALGAAADQNRIRTLQFDRDQLGRDQQADAERAKRDAADRAAADQRKRAADVEDDLRQERLQQDEADARDRAGRADNPADKKAAEQSLLEARRRTAADAARRFGEEKMREAYGAFGGDPARLAGAMARIADLTRRMAVVPDAVDQATAAPSTRGTFSAIAAGLLGGGGGYAERAAKAAEQTVKELRNTKRAVEKIAAPVFG